MSKLKSSSSEAENYAADQEADRIKKLYKAYLESIQALHIALGGSDKQGVNPALFEFLNQQKWATAYEKSSSDQKTFVLYGSGQPPSMALPSQFNEKITTPSQKPGAAESSPAASRTP